MKARAVSEKYEVVAEINMIPFIDIALVLLIIFMIMTPFLVKEQIKINFARTKGLYSAPTMHNQVQIDITRKGEIYVDGAATAADNVYQAIKRRLTDPENQPVVIAADRDVAFEKVVVVMDAAKRCNARQLGVSVKHDDRKTGTSDSPRRSTRP